MRHPPSIVRGKSMRRTQRSSQRSAVSADSRQTGQTSVDTEQAGAEDQAAKSRGGSKKSANLVIDLDNIKVNGNTSAQSGQYLETPKQSPDVEPPRPSIMTEGGGKQEKQERMLARDRFGHNSFIQSILSNVHQVGARQSNHPRRDRVSEVWRLLGLGWCSRGQRTEPEGRPGRRVL